MTKKPLFNKPSGRATDSTLTDAMRDVTGTQVSSTEVIRIHKDFLKPDPDQPRKFFNDEVLERRRVQLEEDGQQELITVWPGVRGEDGNTYYDILDGECRWRSIQDSDKVQYLEAKIETTMNRDDRAGVKVAQLLHNDDGAEALTPLERAYAYRDIVEELQAIGEESPKSVAARKLGLSLSAFSEILSLANLPEDLGQFALDQGVSDARVLNAMVQIHKRGTDSDVQALKETVTRCQETGESVRNAVKDLVSKVKSRKPKKKAAAKGKKSEKPSRLLTARDLKVTIKEDGTGIMTVETPREVIKLNITADQVRSIRSEA